MNHLIRELREWKLFPLYRIPSGLTVMYSCRGFVRGMYDNKNFPGYCLDALRQYGILKLEMVCHAIVEDLA